MNSSHDESITREFGGVRITPFGFVCVACDKSISDSHRSFQRHMQQHKIPITKNGYNKSVEMLCSMQREIRNEWSLVFCHLEGSTQKGFACNCIYGYKYRHVAQRHVNGQHCDATEVVYEDLHVTKNGMLVSLRAFKLHIYSGITMTGLRIKKSVATLKDCLLDNRENEKKTTNIDSILPYIRQDERSSINAYVDMLHGFLQSLSDRNTFEDMMSRCVRLWSAPVASNELEVLVAESLCKHWLNEEARLHVSRTPGNLRAALLVFDSTNTLDVTQNSTFSFRLNTTIVLREAEKVLRYILRLSPPIFVQEILRRECKKDSPDWRIIPRCLKELMLHNGSSFAKDTPIVKYCIARMFRIDGGLLGMSGAGTSANVCGDVLFLLRTAMCSCLYEDEDGGTAARADNVIKTFRTLRTLNTLAPMIRRLRETDNSKPNRYKSTVTTEGDVLVRSFIFRKDVIRWLVPTVVERCIAIFQQIFANDKWNCILDSDNQISVRQDEEGWFDFETGNRDNHFTSATISITKTDNIEVLTTTMMGYVDMFFHGFGGGPMRYHELQRMMQLDVVWHNNTMYYTCTSKKKYSCLGMGNRVTERKLPQIAARIVLLHQRVVKILRQEGRPFTRPFGIDCVYMQDAVSCIFGLRDNPSCLECRHLWLAVANIVSSQNHTVEFLSTSEEGSDLAGHSYNTHMDRYASGREMGKENFFGMYHQFIGCQSSAHRSEGNVMPEIDSVDLVCALELVYGQGSGYMSKQQKELVQNVACSTKHTVAVLHCGAGKSLSWILPIVAARQFGRQFGSIIVVQPYRFLAAYHFQSACDILGFATNIKLNTIFGNDVSEKVLPFFLDNTSMIPDLIFVTIDAFACLSKYHEATLARLSGEGIVSRIIFDEVHTVFTELFRASYEELKGVRKYGIPITLMSATMTDECTLGLATYMNIDRTEMVSLHSTDFFGSLGDDFRINVTTSSNPSTTASARALHLLRKETGNAVHVIVSVKSMCDAVVAAIGSEYTTAILTSNSTEQEQRDISVKWACGKINVLVSTTCGLCGNENKLCRHVIICGHIYSLTNVVQSMGRVRPSQRNNGSTFEVILGDNDKNRSAKFAEYDEGCRSLLISRGMLNVDNSSNAMKVCGKQSVVEWVKNEIECRIVSLASYFGRTVSKCMNCDICIKQSRGRSVDDDCKGKDAVQDNKNENEALLVLRNLQTMCLVCRSKTCDGEGCLPFGSCYLCAGRHRKSECKNKISHVFEGRGCQYCYDLFSRRGYVIHDATNCPLKRRLRRCAQDLASKNSSVSYQQFVITNFCETRTYNGFLIQCGSHYSLRQSFDTKKTAMDNESSSERQCVVNDTWIEKCKQTAHATKFTLKRQCNVNETQNTTATTITESSLKRKCIVKNTRVDECKHAVNQKGKCNTTSVMRPNPYLKKSLGLQDVTNTYNGILYSDYSNNQCPLLPPDYYPHGIERNTADLNGHSTRDELRSLYLFQLHYSKSRRCYVDGALYKNLFPGYILLDDMEVGGCNIHLNIDDQKETFIKVRQLHEDLSIASDIVCLGMLLGKTSGNCRKTTKDIGEMYAMGIRSTNLHEKYKCMHDSNVNMLYKRVRSNMVRLLKSQLPDDYDMVREIVKEKYELLMDNYVNEEYVLGISTMLSKNLGNAAHLDVGDKSRTIAVFCEELIGQAKNWFFIFPDASINGSKGVVVKLCHGMIISWDAATVMHCTTVTDPGLNNNVYGCAFGVFAVK